LENKSEQEEAKVVYRLLEEIKFQESIDVEKNWNQLSVRISGLHFRLKLLQFCRNVAAVLFIPLLLVSGYLYLQKNENLPVEMIEQTCASGLVSAITLVDGTQVWLNSGSKLIYPKEFRNKTRTVKLEGEGYFKIQADKSRRFDVELINGTRVSAYGTEFNISAYYGNNDIEVVLAKGNIDVISKDNQLFSLEPSYQLTLSEGEPIVEKTNIYVKTAWKDGKMVFRRADLKEIVRKLALHFNAEIELLDEEIGDFQISATFTNESLLQILRLIEKSTPICFTVVEPAKMDDFSFTKQRIVIQSVKKPGTNKK